MESAKKSLSAWTERRPERTESERAEIARAFAAHLPEVEPIIVSNEDLDAMRAAFIRRFDEDLPRTETLMAVAQIGRRIEARHRTQAEAASAATIAELVEALEAARVRFVRIAGRDFDCSPHQHGMAAAGHAQQGVHEVEATLAKVKAQAGGEG